MKLQVLAEGFANTGYLAPMNVLWTYHFINNNTGNNFIRTQVN